MKLEASPEERKFLKKLGLKPLPKAEQERRARARERLRKQCSSNPYYAKRLEEGGEAYLHSLQSSQALAD